MKIALGTAVPVVLLGLAGAGYEYASRDRELNPAASNVAAGWVTDDGRTRIDLRPDGTFTAQGISNCIGPVSLVDMTAPPVTNADVAAAGNIADGAGTWIFEPQPGTNVDALVMRFRGSDEQTLWWMPGPVEWRFHPLAVTLLLINHWDSGDPQNMSCTLHTP